MNETSRPGPTTCGERNRLYHRKIVDADALAAIMTEIRAPTAETDRAATIVQCHGCFDIVHPGHIRYLEFARSQGDVLVVSITGDAEIDKGAQRPYIPQELRAENLAALEFVDYVVIDPHPTASRLLEQLRPDIYVKGHEYATSQDAGFLAERRVVESYGGRVIFSSGQVIFSSSRLIDSLPTAAELGDQRLRLICGRHGVTHERILNLIESFRGRRVLVIGDTHIERYVLCDATDVSGESPMMALDELDARDYFGGAAFVAAQAARLGAESVLVTSLGDDVVSAQTRLALHESGVSVRDLHHRPDLPIKTRYLVDDHKVLKVTRAPVQPLDSQVEQQAASLLLHEAAACDVAIVLDGGYGLITPGLAQYATDRLRSRLPVMTAGMAGPHGDLASARKADLLCATERRLRAAMNDFGSGLSAVVHRMLQATGALRMLVLLGNRGVVAFDRRSHDPKSADWESRLTSEHVTALTQRPVDQLGGVESILTVASLSVVAGAALMQAAYLGAALAAVQTASPGLTSVDLSCLKSWIGERPELQAEPRAERFPALRNTMPAAMGLIPRLSADAPAPLIPR